MPMKPKRKPGPPHSRIEVRAFACMEKVLEVCAQLPSQGGDPQVLREYIAESGRKIFQAAVAGVLVREGESYQQGAVSSDEETEKTQTALLSHVRSFAVQAIEQKRLLNFRFAYLDPEVAEIYY